MRGRFLANITAGIALRSTTTQLQALLLSNRPVGGLAIMIMHPVNLAVPPIWAVAIVRRMWRTKRTRRGLLPTG
jgi:hypothetical protein